MNPGENQERAKRTGEKTFEFLASMTRGLSLGCKHVDLGHLLE